MKLCFLFLWMIGWYCSTGEVLGKSLHPIRILFVGNSLTYTNDIPALVKKLGELDGINIEYKTIVGADYGLEDHLSEGTVQNALAVSKYDFVVIQQGPSALPASQINLMSVVQQYKMLCDHAKTKLAVYMVWPSKSRLFDLDQVIYSYSNAAKKNDVIVCPAGLAWKKTWAMDSSISLYGPDGFHPDTIGSLLSAMVIYGTLTRKYMFEKLESGEGTLSKYLNKRSLNILKKTTKEAIETKW